MTYDYSKLSGRIREKYGSQENFAVDLGLSTRSMSLKMTGKIDFKQKEIIKSCALLEISEAEIPIYFFALKVQSR